MQYRTLKGINGFGFTAQVISKMTGHLLSQVLCIDLGVNV